MKKVILFIAMFLALAACNRDTLIDQGAKESQRLSHTGIGMDWVDGPVGEVAGTDADFKDIYVQPGEALQRPGNELEARSPDACFCEFIGVEFPTIEGLTNWVFVYDGVTGANVRFLFRLYRWEKPNGGWLDLNFYGDATYIAEYCSDEPYEDSRTIPRHIFGRAGYFCNGWDYLMTVDMYAKTPAGVWYYCGSKEEVFEYHTEQSGQYCSPNR